MPSANVAITSIYTNCMLLSILSRYSMAIRINANQQRETQLLMEWLLSLGKTNQWKTHVNVGAEILQYNGKPLTPAQQKAFGVWNSWADARVFTGTDVLLVEAKIVATGT